MDRLPTPISKPTGPIGRRRFLKAAKWGALSILTAASLAVRFHFLARKPFWFDECFSVEIARIDWRNFLRLMWWREANMALYYLLLKGWLHFGQSPSHIRSLSVVISGLTVPVIYWVARALYDRRVGLIAAALFTFNAYSVRYAQEARSYSLFLLLTALSSGLLVAWLRTPSERNWLGYVLASSLAVYAHFYALLLITAHWLAVVPTGALQVAGLEKFRARELRRAWLTIGILVSPLLIFVAKTGAGPIKWIERPRISEVFSLFERLAGGSNWVLAVILGALSLMAVAKCGTSLWLRARGWEIWRCQFLLIWLLFPIVLTVLLSFARPVFLARYMIFCLPAFLILAAAGIVRLKPWWLSSAAAVVILVLCARGVSFVYAHDFDLERDAAGAASNFILNHSQAGDGIVFHIAGTRIAYECFRTWRAGENTASPDYHGQLGPEIVFPRHGEGVDSRDFTGKPTAELVHDAAGAHRRMWVMLMDNGTAGNPDATTVMLSRVLAETLPRMYVWEFYRVEVRLYSRD